MPFFLFAVMFLIYPSSTIALGSFQDTIHMHLHLQNFVHLLQNPNLIGAYWISVKISLITSLGGGIFGFLLAYSCHPGWIASFHALQPDDLLWSGLELCGCPAGLCIHCLAQSIWSANGLAEGNGLQSIFPRLPTLHFLGIEHRVHVLPIPLDGIGRRASD